MSKRLYNLRDAWHERHLLKTNSKRNAFDSGAKVLNFLHSVLVDKPVGRATTYAVVRESGGKAEYDYVKTEEGYRLVERRNYMPREKGTVPKTRHDWKLVRRESFLPQKSRAQKRKARKAE